MKYHKTDLKKVKERYDQISTGQFWTPKEGENLIRILPPYGESGLFFREVDMHFGVGKNGESFVCTRAEGGRCYACEKLEELRSSDDPEKIKLARKFVPRHRVLYNIVDLNEPSKGVRIFSSGTTIFKDILSYFADPDWGDITDPENGYDIRIIREGTGLETSYRVQAKKNPTPIADPEWLTQLHDLDSVVQILPYERQREIIEGTASPASEEPEPKAEPEEKVEEQPEEENTIETVETEKPKCFGIGYNRLDPECQECPYRDECIQKKFSGKKKEDDLKKKFQAKLEELEKSPRRSRR